MQNAASSPELNRSCRGVVARLTHSTKDCGSLEPPQNLPKIALYHIPAPKATRKSHQTYSAHCHSAAYAYQFKERRFHSRSNVLRPVWAMTAPREDVDGINTDFPRSGKLWIFKAALGQLVGSHCADFASKRSHFKKALQEQQQSAEHDPAGSRVELNVRKNQAFLDSLRNLGYKTAAEVRHAQLQIHFHGDEEDAQISTWLALVLEQIFNPDCALFTAAALSDGGKSVVHPNPLSGINQEHLLCFRFAGRIARLCLREGQLLPVHLSKTTIHGILTGNESSPPLEDMLDDMRTLDSQRYATLDKIMKHEILGASDQTFSFHREIFGATEVVDLIEDGRNVMVTGDNKREYVRLTAEHALITSVKEQLSNFSAGLIDVVPMELFSGFGPSDFDRLLSGSS